MELQKEPKREPKNNSNKSHKRFFTGLTITIVGTAVGCMILFFIITIIDLSESPEPQGSAYVYHIVEPGQFLSRIAALHYGSTAMFYIELILEANNIINPDDIYVGQRLVIPMYP